MKSAPDSNEPIHAWLWQNEELADVAFDIVYPVSVAPTQLPSPGPFPLPRQSVQGEANGVQPSNLSIASTAHTPMAAGQDSSSTTTKTYLLHSQVVSSSSAFLRASLTSGVGSAKRKRDSTSDACRWHLRAEMGAEDAGAVEAVLKYLYTQELEDDTPGPELLRIMQVSISGPASIASFPAQKIH